MASEIAKENYTSVMPPPNSLAISSSPQRSFFMAQIILRFLVISFTVAANVVMVTNTQSIMIFNYEFIARYTSASAFKFLVGVNAVVGAFSVLSLIVIYLLSRSGSHLRNYFFLFLHDMVVMVLMISGCATATAVGYVARNGEANIGWVAVCDQVGKFCNRGMISIALSYLAFFSYFALIIMSANKLMSRVE